jgi:hypothetical protein
MPYLIRILSSHTNRRTTVYNLAQEGKLRWCVRCRQEPRAWTRGSRQLPRLARVAIVSSRQAIVSRKVGEDSGGRWQLAMQLGKVFWARLAGSSLLRRDLSLSHNRHGSDHAGIEDCKDSWNFLPSHAPCCCRRQNRAASMLTGCYCMPCYSTYGRLLSVYSTIEFMDLLITSISIPRRNSSHCIKSGTGSFTGRGQMWS